MAELERTRESVQGSLDPEYLKQREKAGWRLVGVEWEREAEVREPESEAKPGPRAEDPRMGCAWEGTAHISKKIRTRCSFCSP